MKDRHYPKKKNINALSKMVMILGDRKPEVLLERHGACVFDFCVLCGVESVCAPYVLYLYELYSITITMEIRGKPRELLVEFEASCLMMRQFLTF